MGEQVGVVGPVRRRDGRERQGDDGPGLGQVAEGGRAGPFEFPEPAFEPSPGGPPRTGVAEPGQQAEQVGQALAEFGVRAAVGEGQVADEPGRVEPPGQFGEVTVVLNASRHH